MNAASNPPKAKQPQLAARPAEARHALLGAFEKAASQLRLKARGELLLERDDWRPVKAGIIAAQLVARVLVCSLEDASARCERAVSSGPGMISGQESTLEDRLVHLAAVMAAWYHLTVKGGHLPAAVLQAVAKDLKINHDWFGHPDVIPILEAAVERHRVRT